MTARQIVPVAIGVALLALLAWGVVTLLERMSGQPQAVPITRAPLAPAESAHISATLFYGTVEGDALVPVRREVPLADGVVAQGREILMAQLGGAPTPYVSVIPTGTTLRAFYVTEAGDAFVDLSGISSGHPGGSLTELLTVHAIVHAVTTNLPAVQRVQILIDGKEMDTVAGHVDIRRPLTPDPSLVREPDAAP